MEKKTRSGGGAATHAGTNYQDYVTAWVAVQILAEQDVALPWGLPATVTLEALHAETPNHIDDLTVLTSVNGRALTQAKHTVNLETTATSPLGGTVAQFVKEYDTTNPAIDPATDRFVLIASPTSSAGIKTDLPNFLTRMRTSSDPREWTTGNAEQQRAATVLRDHLTREWHTLKGTMPTEIELVALARLIHIHILDVDPGGQAAQEAKNTLRQRILKNPSDADGAWNTLITSAGTYAAHHQRADRPALQRALSDAGFDLQAPRSYREDIERLRGHTTATLHTLLDFSHLQVGTEAVAIQRTATADVRTAASSGHLLVLGIPGAGKSGALYDVAHSLRNQGADVVLFAVDQLEAASTGTLRNELGLAHELTNILAAWPGTTPGYVIIDALDAARTEGAIRTLHALMEEVIASTTRWRVVASVRKFDLRYNTKFQRLFPGTPPSTYADNEFPTTRHINIPTLTDAELAQVSTQSPQLGNLIGTAPSPLRELLRLPFNLRLLAELLGSGVSATELQPVRTQVQLLDRYWRERVIRDDSRGDGRELVLKRTTDAMVAQRALRIPRAAALANDAASGEYLTDLLSTHVLAEWTTPAGTVQREFLTFPHHLLFDYAVARCTIPPAHADLIAWLTAEPDLLIAIRPSIDLHYQRLWHTDPTSFWDLTFQTLAARIPEIGKLIGPSVAALHATSLQEFQLLLDRLHHANPTTREQGMAALRHILMALLANATTTGRFTPSAWCAVLDASTTTMTLETASAARPSTIFLAKHAQDLAPVERTHLGNVARRLLHFALSITPDDRDLLTVGITAVGQTTATDPATSITVLGQCITPNHIQTVGHRTIRVLAETVPVIARIDASFVRDLYQAALVHQNTSTTITTIGNSQIMPFTSNQQQDYKGGLYQLGQHYPAFLQAAPTTAVTTLLAALEAFAREHHRTSQPHATVHLDNTHATLIPDRSESWDSSSLYEHDLPITMLNQFQAHLETLATQPESQTIIRDILATLTTTPTPAVVWRRLLIAGTRQPTTLGQLLRSLAWDHTILTSRETTRLAGTFAQAIHPILDAADRARIENAILALSPSGAQGSQNIDRLLGCLDQANLASSAARQRYTVIMQQGGPPTNTEEPLITHWSEVPAAPTPTDGLYALINPIKRFAQQPANTATTTAILDTVLVQMQELHDALTSPTDTITPELDTEATTELTQAAATIARRAGLTSEHCAQLLPILLRAATHHDPEQRHDEDQAATVTSWSSAPRIGAAETIIMLSRYQTACTPETRATIKQLSIDPVRVVRLQIASHLQCLYHTAPDLLWQLLEYYAADEQNPTVLVEALQTLRRLPIIHASRTAALTERIFNRTDNNQKDVHDACIHIFGALALHANDATSTTIIEGLIADPATHAHALNRLLLDLSVTFTATDQTIRLATFALVDRILTNILQTMRTIEAGNSGLTTWPTTTQEQYRGLFECADQVAQRLYLASGAFKHQSEDRTILEPSVFYEHAKPLIVQLGSIGHPHIAHYLLDTLNYFIAVDPADVLVLVGEIVRTGSKYGYQYEPLAEALIVEIVERYLAEYRFILREHHECHTALMDILDVFVNVGWPRAHQLTYQLSEIYR